MIRIIKAPTLLGPETKTPKVRTAGAEVTVSSGISGYGT